MSGFANLRVKLSSISGTLMIIISNLYHPLFYKKKKGSKIKSNLTKFYE